MRKGKLNSLNLGTAEEEKDDNQAGDAQSEVVALFEEDNSKLAEAKEFLDLIIKQKETLEKALHCQLGPEINLLLRVLIKMGFLKKIKSLTKTKWALKRVNRTRELLSKSYEGDRRKGRNAKESNQRKQ